MRINRDANIKVFFNFNLTKEINLLFFINYFILKYNYNSSLL